MGKMLFGPIGVWLTPPPYCQSCLQFLWYVHGRSSILVLTLISSTTSAQLPTHFAAPDVNRRPSLKRTQAADLWLRSEHLGFRCPVPNTGPQATGKSAEEEPPAGSALRRLLMEEEQNCPRGVFVPKGGKSLQWSGRERRNTWWDLKKGGITSAHSHLPRVSEQPSNRLSRQLRQTKGFPSPEGQQQQQLWRSRSHPQEGLFSIFFFFWSLTVWDCEPIKTWNWGLRKALHAPLERNRAIHFSPSNSLLASLFDGLNICSVWCHRGRSYLSSVSAWLEVVITNEAMTPPPGTTPPSPYLMEKEQKWNKKFDKSVKLKCFCRRLQPEG